MYKVMRDIIDLKIYRFYILLFIVTREIENRLGKLIYESDREFFFLTSVCLSLQFVVMDTNISIYYIY